MGKKRFEETLGRRSKPELTEMIRQIKRGEQYLKGIREWLEEMK
jgi:hypothetical protein